MTGQYYNLMDSYNDFRRLSGGGFKNAHVILEKLDTPAEKELYNIIRKVGNSTDLYIDNNDRLTTSGLLITWSDFRIIN